MTKYDLVLKASTAELASVVWRFEKGRKRWHDSTVVLAALLAAGVAAAGLAWLRGNGLGDAAHLGLIGGVAAQVVWIIAQHRRSRKYLTGMTQSALQQSPTPVTLGPQGVTFAARHFAWSDFRAAQPAEGMTLLAASNFDGLVIRDQDLSPDLTPDQLQTLVRQWKSA